MSFVEPSSLPLDDPKSGELAKSMIISEAEELFGARDTSFSINEAILYHSKGPQVVVATAFNNLCIVYLSNGSQKRWDCFMYEMAHESVHLLNPQKISASYLEEGVAVWFSLMMCRKHSYKCDKPTGKYRQAYELLLKISEDVPSVVRVIRAKFPNLTDLNADDLQATFPSLTPLDARRLVRRMNY
ncbi:hypothetical protein ACN5LY_000778 [Cronobacter dublinensis]|uniref:hypothetical protein n=1 Tax=Cronobacter dublinensis TaxID=413497 RepID=UPI0024AEACC9|nr:hypothetical protein [Cronobacter dublinensis]MDI7504556.1 hypothetical protein [Cronobacter dublinensis]